jgi:hypothetical protein
LSWRGNTIATGNFTVTISDTNRGLSRTIYQGHPKKPELCSQILAHIPWQAVIVFFIERLNRRIVLADLGNSSPDCGRFDQLATHQYRPEEKRDNHQNQRYLDEGKPPTMV